MVPSAFFVAALSADAALPLPRPVFGAAMGERERDAPPTSAVDTSADFARTFLGPIRGGAGTTRARGAAQGSFLMAPKRIMRVINFS